MSASFYEHFGSLTCWYNIELWVHTHTARGQKASVLSMRNAIQPNLNKTQPLVPDLSMHTEYSRLSCVALPLEKKRLLTTVTICTQLSSGCPYVHWQPWRMCLWPPQLRPDIDITEKWQLECYNECHNTYMYPMFYQDWESIKGVSGSHVCEMAVLC